MLLPCGPIIVEAQKSTTLLLQISYSCPKTRCSKILLNKVEGPILFAFISSFRPSGLYNFVPHPTNLCWAFRKNMFARVLATGHPEPRSSPASRNTGEVGIRLQGLPAEEGPAGPTNPAGRGRGGGVLFFFFFFFSGGGGGGV